MHGQRGRVGGVELRGRGAPRRAPTGDAPSGSAPRASRARVAASRWPLRSSAAPARATPPAARRPEPGARARRRARPAGPATGPAARAHAAAAAAPAPGRGAQPAPQEGRQDAPSTTAAGRPAASTRRVRVPPAGNRPSANRSRRSAIGIRTGSSAGPSVARRPGPLRRVAVDAYRERVGVDLDAGRGVVLRHVVFGQPSGCRARHQPAVHEQLVGQAGRRSPPAPRSHELAPRPRATRRTSAAGRTGCGLGIEALASPICRRRDEPALDTNVGSHAEERRIPQHDVGQLAHRHRSDLVVEAVRDRRADRVLGD